MHPGDKSNLGRRESVIFLADVIDLLTSRINGREIVTEAERETIVDEVIKIVRLGRTHHTVMRYRDYQYRAVDSGFSANQLPVFIQVRLRACFFNIIITC